MFTGIVEALGHLKSIESKGDNLLFELSSAISHELKIDQSVSHDGACLTVVKVWEDRHLVEAVTETLSRTALGSWKVGRQVNLERAMKMGARLDGHMVQGHVDAVGTCTAREELDGSWIFTLQHDDPSFDALLIDKGSVAINGVSLTVMKPNNQHFQVSIIPYTFKHTNFLSLMPGDTINLEFDMVGKYIRKNLEGHLPSTMT